MRNRNSVGEGLRCGFVVQCTGCDKDAAGNIVTVHCNYFPDSKSGTPSADTYKVKGNIHWVSARHACKGEVRLYDRLFKSPHPGRSSPLPPGADSSPLPPGEGSGLRDEARDHLQDLNPDSKKVITAYLEPALKNALPEERFQFERHGYFVADLRESAPGKPVFNRAVTLRDSWHK